MARRRQASTYAETDWPQITLLYERLLRLVDNPIIALNHAVAVAMAVGPRAGLRLLDELAADKRLRADHRVPAVRAHLLELLGDDAAARESYLRAARQTTSLPTQRYLYARAAALTAD